MRVGKFVIVVLLPLLTIGCGNKDIDKSELEKSITITNKRIESMMKDYDTSRFKATKFYESTLSYLDGSSSELDLGEDVDTYYVEEFKSVLDSYKEVFLEMYEEDKLLSEERGIPLDTFEDYVSESGTSYYFLNESNATLEQDIMYRLPYGKVLGFQIEWLGGDIFGFQTYTNN